MKLSFRQGIVSHQTNQFIRINGNNVELRTDERPVKITIAHRDTNYLHVEELAVPTAWEGPFDPAKTYWLYWEFSSLDFTRTFGATEYEPTAQATPPTGNDAAGIPFLIDGRMWFDTTNIKSMVYLNGMWRETIRVLAAKLTNGNTLSSVSINAPEFIGTQIGNNHPANSGRVVFTGLGTPVKRDNKTFMTTETAMFVGTSRSDGMRLESNIVQATCVEPSLSKFSVVAYSDMGKIRTAQYEDTTETIIALLTDNLLLNETGNITLQGVVTNEAWSFTTVGKPLWVDNGMLVDTDPHITDAIKHPIPHVPVARVQNVDTVIFEQGLGGRGERGPATQSTYVLPPASTTVRGGVTFVTAPSNVEGAKAISDTDPRLTDPRTPLPHQHTAETTSLASTVITSTNVKDALESLDTAIKAPHTHSAAATTFTPGTVQGDNVQTAIENVKAAIPTIPDHTALSTSFASTVVQGDNVKTAIENLNTTIQAVAAANQPATPNIYPTLADIPAAATHKGEVGLLDSDHVMVYSTGTEWLRLAYEKFQQMNTKSLNGVKQTSNTGDEISTTINGKTYIRLNSVNIGSPAGKVFFENQEVNTRIYKNVEDPGMPGAPIPQAFDSSVTLYVIYKDASNNQYSVLASFTTTANNQAATLYMPTSPAFIHDTTDVNPQIPPSSYLWVTIERNQLESLNDAATGYPEIGFEASIVINGGNVTITGN